MGKTGQQKKVLQHERGEGGLWEAIGPVALSAVREWVQALETELPGTGKLKLSDVTTLAHRTRNRVLAPIVEAIVRHEVERWDGVTRTECPMCGTQVFRKRLGERSLLTLVGPMVVPDPYFYCADCEGGFSPVATALELADTMRQYDVQAMVSKLAAKMSYKEAAEIGELIVGEKIAESTTHDHVQALAGVACAESVIPSAEELQRRLTDARSVLGRDPVVVVAADGAMTPIRPEGGRAEPRGEGYWRETKGFRVLLESGEEEVETLASWHQIGDPESLKRALTVVTDRLPSAGFQVVLVADGAPWIWSLLTECFPGAIQVLDYYHLAEHVFDCAHAQYGESLRAEEWAVVTLARLSHNHVGAALGGLRRMIPRSKEAKERDRYPHPLPDHPSRPPRLSDPPPRRAPHRQWLDRGFEQDDRSSALEALRSMVARAQCKRNASVALRSCQRHLRKNHA